MENFKNNLPVEVYDICWNKGAEPAFSGKYDAHYEVGTYHCVCCKAELFSSETKYNSNSGWPSFFNVISSKSVRLEKDDSHNVQRSEVLCNSCGSHLGHVFNDGPEPTKKRYCINSLALSFIPTK